VPDVGDQNVCLALDCFDRSGSSPSNIFEHWADDVSEDVAREVRHRADLRHEDLSSIIEDFGVRHTSRERQLI
jgi:hypothetical protein